MLINRYNIFSTFLILCFFFMISFATAVSQVEFIWSGGVTKTSARIKCKIIPDSSEVRILVSLFPNLSSPIYSQPDSAITSENYRVADITISGLQTDQQYYYAPEINGTVDSTALGKFKTFPTGVASFSLALSSCALTATNNPVFETIRGESPLLFLHMGDFHYLNIATNNRDTFRAGYDTVFTAINQSNLYRDIPIAYIWDDHDYGPNNSDSTAVGRVSSRLTYQEYVPHYPLAEGSGDVAIYQAFTVGRVRFILCDSRSARSPFASQDNSSKTMLGTVQKEWFKQQLLDAKDKYPLIVWVNSLPWIGTTGDDGWYLYTNERAELANFIADNGITNICMVSGDSHMLAVDDGTNSDYSNSGMASFPVLQSAALDRSGSVKGGPYSHGTFPNGGQYTLMTVNDRGDSVDVIWSCRNYLNVEFINYTFSFSANVLTTTDEESQVTLPDKVTLYNNYPNPFNNSTVIRYHLPASSHVKFTINDMLGRVVTVLVDNYQTAGEKSIIWNGLNRDGNHVASGNYFYNLITDKERQSKKMLLIK